MAESGEESGAEKPRGEKRPRSGEEDDDELTLVRRLRLEAAAAGGAAGGTERCAQALDTICTLLRNVLEHPEDERYRTIRLANPLFHARVGAFPSGLRLLRTFGFEDAQSAGAGSVTHLALPVADASELARGLVLLHAAREALALVDADANPAARRRPEPAPAAEPPPAASYTRAEGKRPARREDAIAPERAALPGVPGASAPGGRTAPAPSPTELAEFSAAGIERFFAAHAGEDCGELAGANGTARLDWLMQAATDAVRVAADDADAARSAARWLGLLAEHGALLGWRAAGADGGAPGARGERRAAPASGASGSGGGGGAEEAEEGEEDEGEDQHAGPMVGADGNFEMCAECGVGGDLVCCEGCPQVYHAECLGPFAPPPDDDSDWFCPQCAKSFGM